jgi:hypothetical protein
MRLWEPPARRFALHSMPKPLTLLALFAAIVSLGATSATVFDSYREALAKLKLPQYMEFAYTDTRSGPGRIVTEQHQVYWSASGAERNDTVQINGTPVVPARSQVIHRAAWPYDPNQFLVSSDEYDVTPAGSSVIAGRKAYGFILNRTSPADFILKSLYVDAKRRLPVRQTFAVAGSDCEGSGAINFGPVGSYWLPGFLSVVCMQSAASGGSQQPFKESIRFSNYQFPAAIPADVFQTPQSSGESGPSTP